MTENPGSPPDRPLDPRDRRTLERLASLPGPAKPTRVDAAILGAILVAGVVLLSVGLGEGCVLKGISGGLLVGASLALLLVLPHARTLCAGRQLLFRLLAAPRATHPRPRPASPHRGPE